MRLAFVIQRYGLEVNGGAELHCRWLAERLARRHQVEVFATRALDYLEWRNHYREGTEMVNGVPVHRYTVKRTRNARAFASLSNLCFHESHTREEEEAWVRENGPFSRTQASSSSRVCASWKHTFDSDANTRALRVRFTVWRCTGIPFTTSVPSG